MRIITEKDKRGLLLAIRCFLRHLNGERISQPAASPLIDKILSEGITFDVLLNPENWERCAADKPGLTFKEYVDMLIENNVGFKEIKEQKDWHDQTKKFPIIAEAAHDFYQEVSGRGGRWNIPSSMTNLAKAIERYSLEALLSEKLIENVNAKSSDVNYFGYVSAIAEDFKTIEVDMSPTAEELKRFSMSATAEQEEIPPEDIIYPEPEEEAIDSETGASQQTVHVLFPNPNDTKRKEIQKALMNYSVKEILGLVALVEEGEEMTLFDLLSAITYGRFDVTKETEETSEIHRELNNDLLPYYIMCVNGQGVQMDEEMAAKTDILHESWDFSTPNAKKHQKLLKLIYTHGKDDPDLLDAVCDIEKLYGENC